MDKEVQLLIEKLEFMTNKKVSLKESNDIIGKTQSGKPIYRTAYQTGTNIIRPEHKDFSKEDHMDAINLHKKLYNKHNTQRKEILKQLNSNTGLTLRQLLAAKRNHNYEMANHRQQGYSHAEYYANHGKKGDISLYPPVDKPFR